MTEPVCPPICEEDRERIREDINTLYEMSWPCWARGLLITIIGIIFMLISSMSVYALTSFATKEEIKTLREEVRETNADIKTLLLSIDRKLSEK